ncbi:receptor protein kinase CLAVATA1-like [Hibiscus syriacus]|uniref:Receptor protein kinase CLAVATA1-like n=1 Tax=Hibiscus syriacus TaxID=106335 RepID=A0A6A2X375_HIBSY|nr:receptor protein kinase CLAVATA1-like [Hibiscus syriacus]
MKLPNPAQPARKKLHCGDGKNTDGVMVAMEMASEYKENESEPTIASGLDFADKKKSRGLPPGLVPISDPFPEGDLPDVEIIVGDTSKFEEATTPDVKQNTEEDSVYKPKVSTWGVFPRRGNISKTALKDGDSLMDSGKLKEALSYYERVMEKMPFKSELHGVAALQWSICQDSLSRPKEARVMYEKLQSHPNPKVSKKASQFLYSFKAMEMMKVTGLNFSLNNTGYQNFFEAFIEDKANYNVQGSEITEGALNQALPYVIFLLSPIITVLFIAVQKGSAN